MTNRHVWENSTIPLNIAIYYIDTHKMKNVGKKHQLIWPNIYLHDFTFNSYLHYHWIYLFMSLVVEIKWHRNKTILSKCLYKHLRNIKFIYNKWNRLEALSNGILIHATFQTIKLCPFSIWFTYSFLSEYFHFQSSKIHTFFLCFSQKLLKYSYIIWKVSKSRIFYNVLLLLKQKFRKMNKEKVYCLIIKIDD